MSQPDEKTQITDILQNLHARLSTLEGAEGGGGLTSKRSEGPNDGELGAMWPSWSGFQLVMKIYANPKTGKFQLMYKGNTYTLDSKQALLDEINSKYGRA